MQDHPIVTGNRQVKKKARFQPREGKDSTVEYTRKGQGMKTFQNCPTGYSFAAFFDLKYRHRK